VNGITIYFQVAAILVVVIGILRIYRQKKQVNNYSQELKSTVLEAKSVCEDLTEIMEDALSVSQVIVDDLDKKMDDIDQKMDDIDQKFDDIDQKIAEAASLSFAIPAEPVLLIAEEESREEIVGKSELAGGDETASSNVVDKSVNTLANKIRVYNLAQEVGMPSKEMVSFIRGLGMDVVNHMNCLDDEQILAIKKALPTITRPVFNKAFEQASARELNLQPAMVEISKPHLVTSDSDGGLLNTAQQSSGNSKNHIVSIEDLRKAHPYLAVRMLRERGYSIRDIAQMLDRGQGEVSLIINLSARKKACS